MSVASRQRDYSSTHVLLIHFKTQDMTSLPGLKKLRSVFKKKYHFEVTTIALPDRRPEGYLEKRLWKFMSRHDDPKKLLIFCYFGHGGFTDLGTPDRMIGSVDFKWTGYKEMQTSVNWSKIQDRLIAPSRASVLLIFDCCHTSAAAECAFEWGQYACGPKELLGACRWGDETQQIWFSVKVAHEFWRAATSEAGSIDTADLQARLRDSWESKQRPPAEPVLEGLSAHATGGIQLKPELPVHLRKPSVWRPWEEISLECMPNIWERSDEEPEGDHSSPPSSVGTPEPCSSSIGWGQPTYVEW